MDHSLCDLYSQLAQLAAKHGAEKLVLFGSRAREDYKQTSDIDLAIYGMAEDHRGYFGWEVENLPTLLQFDLVFVSPSTSSALLENIKKDGVVLMDRAMDKRNKLKAALSRLDESLAEYAVSSTAVVRDGVIQRFEFCTELAWKATREYLIDQGYTAVNSPKGVMRQAYADGVITDEAGWIKLLDDRNLTSHMYDDNVASQVFEHICTQYIELFHALYKRLSE